MHQGIISTAYAKAIKKSGCGASSTIE